MTNREMLKEILERLEKLESKSHDQVSPVVITPMPYYPGTTPNTDPIWTVTC